MTRRIILFAAAAALAWGQTKQPEERVKNVELTVYLLSGVQAPGTDDVPQDLNSTVKQLHSLFTYKSYKLADSFILRGRADSVQSAGTEGILPGSGLHYSFSYNRARVSNEKPYMVHIDMLRISLYTREVLGDKMTQKTIAGITTSLDLTEDQKTVVGKSSINSNGDALILVLVPKVIE